MLLHALKLIWAQKWKQLRVAKIQGKRCFRCCAFMIDYISTYKSKLTFMGLDFEADKSIINAALRVMMAEL